MYSIYASETPSLQAKKPACKSRHAPPRPVDTGYTPPLLKGIYTVYISVDITYISNLILILILKTSTSLLL